MHLINGQPASTVFVMDRGFQYGDGLFETLAVINGRPAFWQRHMERLEEGCRRLGIPCPPHAVLLEESLRAAAAHGDGVLKIIVTRGVGERGYACAEHTQPTRVVAVLPAPARPTAYGSEGVRVRYCRTRASINPALAGIKHLNRLEQILARREWQDGDIAEGLMLDAAGNLAGGTMSNLFVVEQSRLLTPDVSGSGVAGVARSCVMELACRADFEVEVTTLTPQRLESADGAFLCNALVGIWPIRQLDNVRFSNPPLVRTLASGLQAWKMDDCANPKTIHA